MAACTPMKPLHPRRLTAAERALAREMFGEGLDCDRVRILSLPFWNRAFVPGGRLIVWPARSALEDFGGEAVPLRTQAVFVHEMTHVWQAQRGINLIFAKLRAGDRDCDYAYDLTGECRFETLNIEQQAMIFEHAFLASRGERAPYPTTRYAQVLPTGASA